jgi:hypothetical protein
MIAQRRQVEPWEEFAERQLEIVIVDDHVDDDLADGKTHHAWRPPSRTASPS